MEDSCLTGSTEHLGSRGTGVRDGDGKWGQCQGSLASLWSRGRKGKRSSRQLGMSHNYRRKIRPEPGSPCLCLSDHRPYYKATNY